MNYLLPLNKSFTFVDSDTYITDRKFTKGRLLAIVYILCDIYIAIQDDLIPVFKIWNCFHEPEIVENFFMFTP